MTSNRDLNKLEAEGTSVDLNKLETEGSSVDAKSYLLKIMVIGNSGVGKTAFLLQYCDKIFTPSCLSTVGVDFKMKAILR